MKGQKRWEESFKLLKSKLEKVNPETARNSLSLMALLARHEALLVLFFDGDKKKADKYWNTAAYLLQENFDQGLARKDERIKQSLKELRGEK